MFSAMQFLFYELAQGLVNGILLQFIGSVSMAYLSGFFYPERFFPDTLKRIGEILPTGVALQYTDQSMLDTIAPGNILGVLLYLVLFLSLSVLVRKHRIQRG
jgi:ABC-type uncharacterized transport system permease subunit